jgi:uncharacterized SAM-binding protein YcdF (DUF218 family)
MPPKKGASGSNAGAGPGAGAVRLRGLIDGIVLGAAFALMSQQIGISSLVKASDMAWFVPSVAVGAVFGLAGAARVVFAVDLLIAIVMTVVALDGDVATSLVRRFQRDDGTAGPPVQAVVVLSSGLSTDGMLDVQGVERLLSGLALVKRENVPILVTTRTASGTDAAVTSDADQGRLVALAATSARWLPVGPVDDTHDEALRTAALMQKEGVQRIALVTSPMHTRRACAVFEAVGLKVRCVPAISRDVALRSEREAKDRVRTARLALYEWVGWQYNHFRGWLP